MTHFKTPIKLKLKSLVAGLAVIVSSSVFLACGGGSSESSSDSNNSAQGAASQSGNQNNSQNNSQHGKQSASEAKLLASLQSAYIEPRFARASTQSAILKAKAHELCAAPSQTTLTSARRAWTQAMTAWSATQAANFFDTSGKLASYFVYIFPDSNNRIAVNIDSLLSGTGELTAVALENETASVNGLAAIEYVLFAGNIAPSAFTKNSRRCALLSAQTSVLDKKVKQIHASWQVRQSGTSFGKQFVSQTGQFVNPKSALTEIYNGALTLAENLKDARLGFAAGISKGVPKDHFEARYAQQSRLLYNQGLAALSDILLGNTANNNSQNNSQNSSQIGLAAFADSLGGSNLKPKLAQQLGSAQAVLGQITQDDLAKATNDQKKRLYDALSILTTTIKGELSTALGVQVSFNANDGD